MARQTATSMNKTIKME